MLKSAWRFRAFIRPHRVPLVVGAFLVVGMTLADLAQPWPLKVIVDGAIDGKPQTGWLAQAIAGAHSSPGSILLHALVGLAVLVGLSAALDFSSEYLMESAGERITVGIRQALFSHLQRLSLLYHDQQRVGDLVSRVTGDIDRLQNMLVAVFDTLIPNVVMLVGLAAAMLWIDVRFGLLALSIAPLLFFVTYRYTLRIKQASRRARLADAQIATLASETLAAIRAVQSFGREEHEDRRFADHNAESFHAAMVALRLKAAFTPLVDVVSLGGTLLVIYVGVHGVLAGQLTVGLLLVFLSYLKSLYRPMRALSRLAYLVSQGTVSAERVQQVLEVDNRVPERPHARSASNLSGQVELRNVTFAYGPGRLPVLREVSMRVEPGERIGLVGRTGAGKSTLVSLIPRFYDPDEGAVLADGIDVRDLQLKSLRRQVSLVLQDPILFYGSILENIRYGDPLAPLEKVWDVAEAAHVTEFVEGLPDGILTVVGERGTTLSGGQRQRIAIARAMLCDAPILILDEPTTGLDREAEALVLEGLARLAANRTTFVISHHHGALQGVTRTCTIVDGSLVEVPRDGGGRNAGTPVGPARPWVSVAGDSPTRRVAGE